MDQQHQLPITITCIPQVFFDFQMYIPGLASMQVSLRSQLELGNMRHPSLLLQSSVPPTQLADQLRPWMEATKQCMWVCQYLLLNRLDALVGCSIWHWNTTLTIYIGKSRRIWGSCGVTLPKHHGQWSLLDQLDHTTKQSNSLGSWPQHQCSA